MSETRSSTAPLQGDPAGGYRYVVVKTRDIVLPFETAKDVFFPTHTSQLLINGARRAITTPGKLLDLGCGIGVCGLVLATQGLCRQPVYLSDLSERAMALVGANARALKIDVVARQGSLFAPWAGETFDVIVDDVSGVAEDVARFSSWFPAGVACHSGHDGTALVAQIIAETPHHLNPGGVLLFPVLSLSCEHRILDVAHTVFEEVSLVTEQSWFLPEELLKHFDVLQPLLDTGVITLEHKFGAWLWSTKIYQARSPRPGARPSVRGALRPS